MDIEKLEIARFGCLRDVHVDELGPGVHVFHGTNETGKTTLLEFVRGMLFGFGSLARRGVIESNVENAGSLVVRPVVDGRQWKVLRRRAAGTPLVGKTAHDELQIEDEAGRQHVRTSLEEWTGGLDEASYIAVMAFGLDELHELSSLQSAGCGGRLYELAGGLDRGHVFRVMENLRGAIERADSHDPTISPQAALERRLANVCERIEAAGTPALTRGRQVADARRLRGEIASLEPRLAAVALEEERLLAAIDLEPIIGELSDARGALRRFDPDDLVHPDYRRWRRYDKRRRRMQRAVQAKQEIRQRTAAEGKKLTQPSAVWQKRRLVRPLLDDEPRLERLTAETARAETAALLAARRFGEELGSLGLSRLVDDDTAASHRGSLLPAGFSSAFRSLRKKSKACAVATREARQAAAEVAAIKREISASGAGRIANRAAASQQLAERLEHAATIESLIRKRQHSREQLNDLERSLERLEQEVRERLEGQVLPSGMLTTLGTAFSVGIGLMLSGLFLPAEVTGSMAYAMAAIGLAGAGVAGATTWSLDRTAAARVTSAKNQLATAHRQRQSVLDTLTDLDARLISDSPDSLEVRLVQAQAERTRLEAEATRLANVSDPSERLAEAEDRLAQARHRNDQARNRWRRSLDARGFPSTLTPRAFRELAQHRRHLETLDEERRHAVEDARGIREDLTTVSLPIEQAVAALDLGCEGLSPTEQLAVLRERLAADQTLVRRRKRVRRAFVRARHGHRLAMRRMNAVNGRIAELLRRWDAESDDALLAKLDRRQAYDAAVERLQQGEQAVAAARRDLPQESLAVIDGWLAEVGTHPLEQRAREASARRDQLAASLRDLRERLAGVAAVVDATRQDRNLEPLQSEHAEVAEELAFHRRRRVALQTALALLTETRRRFLEEHQPPVLLEASTWLERLTGSRYRQITAVADDAVLMIEDSDGVRWQPERLSRGTREQVFLALRLALVADLERAGVRLPLIMDDALVNFDDERAKFAAETLVTFAAERGRQMFVLSCHAHVVDLFERAGAHIRGLDGSHRTRQPETLPAPVAESFPVAVPPPARLEEPAEPDQAGADDDDDADMAEERVASVTPTLPEVCWTPAEFGDAFEAAGPGDGIPEIPSGWTVNDAAAKLTLRASAASVASPEEGPPRATAHLSWTSEEGDSADHG